jgi:drug/metabolite transporter (DMT)-like permease
MRGILWALLAMCAFATVPVGVRILTPYLPSTEIVVLRNLIAVAFLVPWALKVGWVGLKPKRVGLHVMRGGLNGMGMILWFWGLGLVPLANAVALQFTLPLFALLLAVLFLGERVGIRRTSAMAVGFMGALVIIRPGFIDVSLATSAILLSAVFYAATLVVMKTQSLNEKPMVIMFWSNLFIALFTLPPALFNWVSVPMAAWPWLVFLALGGWLAHYSLTKSLVTAETKVVASLDFLRLPIVAFVAYPLFGEFPDALTWVGAAIIASAATYIARRDAALIGEGANTKNGKNNKT